jgi:hypothetical protein
MTRPELLKLIDICRDEADLQMPEFKPLADELASDPALARHWENSRRFDRSVREALRDVAVPPGLDERLLRALEAQTGSTPEPGLRVASAARPADVSNVRSGRWSRRWKGGLALLAAAAAVLAAIVTLWPGSVPTLAIREDDVPAWVGMLQESNWLALPPRDPGLGQLSAPPVRWQSLRGLPGSVRIVCYELQSAGPRALLFVAHGKPRHELPAVPPPQGYPVVPWSVGIWRGEAAVYVLAVRGGTGDYQRILRRDSHPVAAAPARAICPIARV